MTEDPDPSKRRTARSPDDPRLLSPERFDAVVFDMDGVVTDTARLHAQAWKETFDELLRAHADADGAPFEPFHVAPDYVRHVDGKPRYDGVRDFLASRGIHLPGGDPSDPPGRATVCGVGNRKNERYLERLRRQGPDLYTTTVDLVAALHGAGIRTAVISASRNAHEVLDAAGVLDLFETRVDGQEAERLGLAGKPAPDVFVEAARRLEAEPERTVVVEDAVSGVTAGRRGGFGLVVGVDRGGAADALADAGADVVVRDLAELHVEADASRASSSASSRGSSRTGSADASDSPRRVAELPSALDLVDTVLGPHEGAPPVFAFDYDGTLTPIVRHPDLAILSPAMRDSLRALARLVPVVVLSGRDLDDVRSKVDLDGLWYAGSHGFDLLSPDGTRSIADAAQPFVSGLKSAADALDAHLGDLDGVWVERKRFAVAVHYREAVDAVQSRVEAAVDATCQHHDGLRTKPGKKIFELQPDIEWDKGRALRRTVDALGCDLDTTHVLYLGDDTTDEDAFRVLDAQGAGILVEDPDAARERTWARYTLPDVDAVKRLIDLAVERSGGVSSSAASQEGRQR